MKGSGFVLIGSLVASILSLVSHVLIARKWDSSNLGIFTIAFSFLTIFSTIGSIGLASAVTRNVAYQKGKNNHKVVPDIIFSSIILTFVGSIIMSVILFAFSEYLAEYVFKESDLVLPLRIFSIAIPINNLISIILSIFKGFNQIKPQVYFQNILQNLFFFLFLIIAIITEVSFLYVFYLFLGSLIITWAALIFYCIKQTAAFEIFTVSKSRFSQAKPLLIFSFPLLGAALIQTSSNWINIFMLGSLKTASHVGLYKSAGVLTGFIIFPIGILLVLYMPVVSNLYGSNKLKELKRIYYVLTKWICFLTLPLFIFIFLFADVIIKSAYGMNYFEATNTLKILSFGVILANYTGPNGFSLIAIGKPRTIMFAILISVCLNILLNFLLIPQYGIEGAAVSVTISLIVFNVVKSSMLFKYIGAHALSKKLLIPSFLTIITAIFIYYIVTEILLLSLWITIILLVVFYWINYMYFYLTKSIEEEDTEMLNFIGGKIKNIFSKKNSEQV